MESLTNHNDHKPPDSKPRKRLPTWAIASAAVILFVTGFTYGINRLNDEVQARIHAQALLFSIEEDSAEESLAMEQALRMGELTPETLNEVEQNRQEVSEALSELEELGAQDDTLATLNEDLRAYHAAVDRELNFLRYAGLTEVEPGEELMVEQSFGKLHETLEETGEKYVHYTERMQTAINAATYALAILAGLAILAVVLIWQRGHSRRAEAKALQRSEERFRTLVQNGSDLITVIDDDGVILYDSPSIKPILGYEDEERIGKNMLEFLYPSDINRARDFFAEVKRSSGVALQIQLRTAHKDGSWLYLENVANQAENPQLGSIILNARDITQRIDLEEQLAHQAFHDPLTGLPNRALLMERTEQALERARKSGTSVTALFLDLDNFKVINDSLGHEVGDELLVAVSKRIRRNLRPTDTLARLGGDEFVILLEESGDAAEVTKALAGRILSELRPSLDLDGRKVYARISIGSATSTSEHVQAEDLLRRADLAMYEAKRSGKGRHAAYDAPMDQKAIERFMMENELRHALDRQHLEVYYQPKVGVASGDVVGVEALLRWNHPEKGFIPPLEFIPIAEETGLIESIGQWVLETACQQMQLWNVTRPADKRLAVSVNLSARQFAQPNLVDVVEGALESSGLSPEHLVLEVTESVLMENAQLTVSTLSKLKGLGVQLAIDDFGTGYSSMNYLKQLPADYLKIDRSFVRGLGEKDEDAAIIQAIIHLARALELRVVAEGVETFEQLEMLREMDSHLAQGFYFARPMPPAELANWFVREEVGAA